ncbi:protein SIX6OS1 isoform X1 [Mus musculus]|nr:protein SIX6OS1 isoform X1 [Mus musculus]XP_011242503.1 protein SIX6OS1 isoform X1 [Mus musculus]XP_011242504.1 protein SIX6OS1 isoform X1 [Mus musculus]XP_011242505.1 protein SIX6OS1 isoform X1 [Mus musculus]|eukprot:XP_011242502.1 PREDICTED: protein SIX6OS1 isoform X1 [Mus musculus]
MNDNLFVSLDRLLLEFVFQYEQDISIKEDTIQRINKCLESIKENKANVSKLREAINKVDEDIAFHYKHSKEIKDSCSNWKPTCDVFHKHEDYIKDQLTAYQETNEKDKKMYHDYICQYEDVLKQYQLKYSETRFSCKYYEKKKEHEEIKNRVLACTEQLQLNETILMKFLVPAPFPSLTKWTLYVVNLRYRTQDILKRANNFTKRSFELEKEADDMEIEINSLNKQMARLFESKTFSEALDEKNKNTEKRKEFEERYRIFEKDEQVSNRSSQNSQLLLPCESQKFVRNMNSSEARVTDKKEESSANQSKFVRSDVRQKENNPQIFNDSGMDSNSKSSHIPAVKSSQGFMQFRLNQPNYNQRIEKEHIDAECGDKETVRQVRESKCSTQALYIEHFGKSIENNSVEEERDENFPQTPETPSFLRTPEALKTPESMEKMQFPKSPFFEITKNATSEGHKQKDSPGFSFLMSYTSRSPGLNLFDSSVSDSEISSDQFNEHYSAVNLNPSSSQQGIGNLFGKSEGEDAFTFSFSSDSSHTFGAGKDDFSFPFSFEQDPSTMTSSSSKDFSSSQNKTQFMFF